MLPRRRVSENTTHMHECITFLREPACHRLRMDGLSGVTASWERRASYGVWCAFWEGILRFNYPSELTFAFAKTCLIIKFKILCHIYRMLRKRIFL